MKNRILICDDEEGMRRYLGKMLAGWGYQTEAFAGPLPLLRYLEETEGEADLLLLDIKMPEMNGIDVAAADQGWAAGAAGDHHDRARHHRDRQSRR